MQITIEYTAQLKRAAGLAAETVDVEDDFTVQQLITDIAARHGDPLAGLLLDSAGAMHPSILLFVGDEQIRWETPRTLAVNETVTFLSPISGG